MALTRCSTKVDGIALAAALESPGHAAVGSETGVSGIRITDDRECLAAADVYIDFTFHLAVPVNMEDATHHRAGVVLGTTGLSKDETAAVHKTAEKIPIVWAPNMSLGVNVLFELVRQAAASLGLDYDAEIVETHHRHKKDAPSGTALGIAEHLAGGRNQTLGDVACYGREGETGGRPRGQIGIHAIRSGDIVGDHTVTFSDDGEQVIIGHRATSRDTFALGALKAARWVKGKAPGIYTMRDVLGLT